MASGPYYLGVDVGGTNTKVGVVAEDGHSLSKVSAPTEPERGADTGVETIARLSHQAVKAAGLKLSDIRGVGVATPGTMDLPTGMLLDPPNLGWKNYPIRDNVGKKLGLPAVLQNDANAAAYGEFWAGAAKHVPSLVFWTLGTGIGCGIIVHDVIIEGQHSHGAECGHIIVQMDGGRLCGTGQYGTLEAYAGGKSLVLRCEEALANGTSSKINDHVKAGEELTPLLIAKCAEEQDELANELIMQSARYMGVGTTTLMHTIDPAMVLLGGAMTFGRNDTDLGRRFIAEIRNEVHKRAFPVPAAKTIIDYASLGGDAGYIGAAGCARQKFGKNPTLASA